MEPHNRGGVSFLIALALSGASLAACEGTRRRQRNVSPRRLQRGPSQPRRLRNRRRGPAPTPPPPAGAQGERVTRTFQLTILSRGSGVPAAAKEAAQQVQKLVDADRARGIRVTVETTRIGSRGSAACA